MKITPEHQLQLAAEEIADCIIRMKLHAEAIAAEQERIGAEVTP